MKTSDLIKQAEELLRLPEQTTSGIFISIAYNLLIQKLIDRLKRYEKALKEYANDLNWSYNDFGSMTDCCVGKDSARKALEEE